ncbi:MAG: GNAT family N-acetyltransferase [Actinomycetota bacterium]|nr:GNAT family N-acetyltransferase [Actinomycetota bacterium]
MIGADSGIANVRPRVAGVGDLPVVSALLARVLDESIKMRGGVVAAAREAAWIAKADVSALASRLRDGDHRIWIACESDPTIDTGGEARGIEGSGLRRDSSAQGASDRPDSVVGIGAAHVELLADGTLHGVIDLAYTLPRARREGIASGLVLAMMKWLTERGCRDIDALALPGDRLAKSLFESEGFKARLLVMNASIAEEN